MSQEQQVLEAVDDIIRYSAVLGVDLDDMPKLFGYIVHLIPSSEEAELTKKMFQNVHCNPIIDYESKE